MSRAKRKAINGPDLMERTRAAVGYLNATGGRDKETEFRAFLTLFHPELSPKQVREMSRNMVRDEGGKQ